MTDASDRKLFAGAPARALADPAAWGILAAALLVHLLLIPMRGYERDLYWFGTWMRTALESGVSHVSEKVWCDYPPGYLYLLKGLGLVWKAVSGGSAVPADGTLGVRFLLKSLPTLADLAGAWLLYRLALPRLTRRGALLVLAAYAFNPAMVFDSAAWGQVDSVSALLLLAAFLLVLDRRTALGFGLLAGAILLKFQVIVVLPVLALGAWHLEGSRGLRAAYRGCGIAGLVLLLPFYWVHRVDSVIGAAFGAVGRYPHISMNAHNAWWLVGGGDSPTISDSMRVGNGLLTYHSIGTAMLGVATLVILWRLWRALRRRPDEVALALFEAAALILIAFYLFPTEMHERYIVPAVAFLAAACCFRPRLAWIYGAVSVVTFVSLATTLNAAYAGQFGPFGGLFPAGRQDAMACAVLFLLLFAVLLLWTPDRRVVLVAPASAIALAGLLFAASHAKVHSPAMLCDWTPIDQSQGWGELRHDRTVDDHRLAVYGFLFRHGLGTHATSRLSYDLNGAFRTFDADAWIDDEANKGQSVQFRVLVDGRVAFDTGIVSGFKFPKHVTADVAGGHILTLEVLDGGDGINSDHVDWLEPMLLR